jgi:radical SAM superfamily enzyme YgiQ (UPF0313 family)
MPFGVSMIAALLEKEHKIKVVDNEIEELSKQVLLKRLMKYQSDVVVFNCNFEDFKEVIWLSKEIKQRNKNIKIILFGACLEYYTTSISMENSVDYLVYGEPELTVLEIIKQFESKNINSKLIKGVIYLNGSKITKNESRPWIKLDELPFFAHKYFLSPKYQIVSKTVRTFNKIKWGFLLTSRGCPYQCKFCSEVIRNSMGKEYRVKSAKLVVDEIEYMINSLGINAISIEDDIFTFDRNRVIQICEEIIKRKLKFSWIVSTRADKLDEELVKLMKKAGCSGMAIGIESGSSEILKSESKGETAKKIEKTLKMLRRLGIAVTGNIIIGHPGESRKDILKTLKLVKKIKPVFIHLHFLTLYPDTQLSKKYGTNLSLKMDHRRWSELPWASLKEKEYKKIYIEFYLKYYLSISYLWTYIRFRYQYLLFNFGSELKFLLQVTGYFVNNRQAVSEKN